MNNFARYSRFLALPIVSAGIIGGAALGLAGLANASTTEDIRPPSIVAEPAVKAHPAPESIPGWHWHHGVYHLDNLQPGYTR
jgi:hypothetical protein